MAGKDAELTLRFRSSDPYDAAIRLLNDAQRFGASLLDLGVDASTRQIVLTIKGLSEVDPNNLLARFSRHPTIELDGCGSVC